MFLFYFIFLRKRLYQSVYEYDLPLFNPAPRTFEFISPEESDLANPWKESFRQLYRGIHVRPGYQDLQFCGRNLCYFNTVQVCGFANCCFCDLTM